MGGPRPRMTWAFRALTLAVAGPALLAAATGIAHADPAGQSVMAQRTARSTLSGTLSSVSCMTARHCEAVGALVTAHGAQLPLAEQWSGGHWRRQAVPAPAGGALPELSGVSCSAARSCEAVGSYGVRRGGSFDTVALAMAWNGVTWRLQAMPGPANSPDVEARAVSCPSASFCEAVGAYASAAGPLLPLAEVWNGSSWQVQQLPRQAGAQLSGVSCLTATFCEAVGSGFSSSKEAMTWNGTSWAGQFTPVPAHRLGIAFGGASCVSVNRCQAVGYSVANGGELPPTFTLAELWDGRDWAVQPTPGPKGMPALAAVSCDSARACMAVGGTFDPTTASGVSLAEQWNGTSWLARPTPHPAGSVITQLSGVSCARAQACEAVGEIERTILQPLAEGWNGHTWRIQLG